ncbi:TPA: hypothetical protein QCX75_001239 [Bacillus mycoides]|uniref:hypothetical protein n=1 Tax=Bacillus sp. FSL P2-0099 TaxID=2921572 RepID=UPI0030F9B1C8|nr:hypothetical protein [Bacillus mycoides]
MTNIYVGLCGELRDIYENKGLDDEYNWKFIDGMSYGFKYMRDYSGLMANPTEKKYYKNKPKLGLFDIKVKVETKNYKVTHKKVICDLLKHSSLKNCKQVWLGKDPTTLTKNIDEEKALVTLGLLMFEQEINWGTGSYQRNTFFSPRKKFRPRDMLMGFIAMFFSGEDEKKNGNKNGKKLLENYSYWTNTGTSPTFPEGDYKLLDKEIANNYFEVLKAVPFEKNQPLIYDKRKEYMDDLASKAKDNMGYENYVESLKSSGKEIFQKN